MATAPLSPGVQAMNGLLHLGFVGFVCTEGSKVPSVYTDEELAQLAMIEAKSPRFSTL